MAGKQKADLINRFEKPVNAATIAYHAGISEASVNNYVRAGIIRQVGVGQFDFTECNRALLASYRDKASGRRVDLDDPMKQAQYEETLEKTRKLKLDNDTKEGVLVEFDDVLSTSTEIVKTLSIFLNRLTDDMERKAGLTIEQMAYLQSEIDAARTSLHEKLNYVLTGSLIKYEKTDDAKE